MPQVKKITLTPFMLMLLSGFLLAGCGDSNPQSTFNSQAGSHPSNWLPTAHKTAATPNTENCAQCHGADYSGGISKVGCFQCHLGGYNSVHPTQWGIYDYALHADYVRLNGTSSCANIYCHGPNLDGVGGTGPSCTQCHLGGINSYHPVAWTNNIILHADYVKTNGDSSCRNAACHGVNLEGVYLSGPSCKLCHS